MIDVQTGFPTENGTYAAFVYYGWRLLEWRDGKWWFEKCTAPWCAGNIPYFVGPLPKLEYYQKPAVEMEFDL